MEPIELSERLGRWSSGRGPLYVLLAGRMRQLIDDGDLPPGTLLPPDRTLASALAVGRTTVVAAYEQLSQDGRIVRRRGSGTRVAGDPRSNALETTAAPMFLHQLEPRDGVILFACAAPDQPPPEIASAYAKILPQLATITHDIGYYPAGHPKLRQAIADRYGVNPDEILVTNGGQQALSLIVRAFVRPGERVVVEAPTYPGALETFREEGAVIRALPVGLKGFAKAVREERPSLAYVIPTFHNPTGSVLTKLEGEWLAAQTTVPLIVDEVPAELGFPGERTPPTLTGEAVLTVGSLSKMLWGGLRIGWIRASVPVISRLSRIRAVHDIGGDTPTQLAAAELVSGLDEWRPRLAKQLEAGHDQLQEALHGQLPDWRVPEVRGGQTLWVQLPYGDGTSFAQAAIRHGVAVLPGAGLDVTGASEDRIRLHFRLPSEIQAEAVRRLAEAWRTYRPPERRVPASPALAL